MKLNQPPRRRRHLKMLGCSDNVTKWIHKMVYLDRVQKGVNKISEPILQNLSSFFLIYKQAITIQSISKCAFKIFVDVKSITKNRLLFSNRLLRFPPSREWQIHISRLSSIASNASVLSSNFTPRPCQLRRFRRCDRLPERRRDLRTCRWAWGASLRHRDRA